jgi:hypothetical protein
LASECSGDPALGFVRNVCIIGCWFLSSGKTVVGDLMGLFKLERKAVMDATETAKSSLNVALVISCAALTVAVIALVIGVLNEKNISQLS